MDPLEFSVDVRACYEPGAFRILADAVIAVY